jgi:16S rRNA (cytosine967-C5)-methyltransferase
MKFFSHLNSAAAIIRLYNGSLPFHHFIKEFFRQHKKYGSGDRKSIAHLAYCYFRLGNMLQEKTVEERIVAGLFLCSQQPNESLAQLQPSWNTMTGLPVTEKCALIGITSPATIFPWHDQLSDGIDWDAFNFSHLQQPRLFVRIRPGYKEAVIKKLAAAGIAYELTGDTCMAFSNATKIDTLLAVNKEVVIQDYSSQRVGELLPAAGCELPGCKIWDCCAASGGKSIMAKDVLGDIDLTVSDMRPSILTNLKKRFAEAGITRYKSFVADLSGHLKRFTIDDSPFTFIIADVPCTGSGTWGRTPEQLTYFKQQEITRYQLLQQKIVTNALPQLQPGGHLLYITCSVFKQENEDMVQFIQSTAGLTLVQQQLFKGYTAGADTMFAALLNKEK